MAIDDVQILASDTAQDTYNLLMDLYDAGLEIDELQLRLEEYREHYEDPTLYEIWISTYALGLWEIGELTEEILAELRLAIREGAGVAFWGGEGDPVGQKRAKELAKLQRKLCKPRAKPRNRRKYPVIREFIFQEDSVLAFQNDRGETQACIVTLIEQHRGHCKYGLTPTTYQGTTMPTIEDLVDVLGVKIGYWYPKSTATLEQPGIEAFWEDPYFCNASRSNLPPELESATFILGLVWYCFEHRDLLRYHHKFQEIGSVKIHKCFKRTGSTGEVTSFDEFQQRTKDPESVIQTFGHLKIPLARIT